MTAIALTIAGSDSGGGAGIQADLKAFSALGAFGASAITAITAQNTRGVFAVHEIPADMVAAQINAVLDDLKVNAVKIGMLSSPEIIQAVAGALSDHKAPIVLDPVMVAKSGDRLLRDDAVAALRETLLPMATLLTPNLPEAAVLADQPEASDPAAQEAQGRALLAQGAGAVLIKGGHSGDPICTDVLLTSDEEPLVLEAERISTKNTHGTGCTLSAAIAARLASGVGLRRAVADAHAYLHHAILAADELDIGTGHGPVHHFHGSSTWKP